LLHQVGDLFELNVKLGCQKVKPHTGTPGINARKNVIAPTVSVRLEGHFSEIFNTSREELRRLPGNILRMCEICMEETASLHFYSLLKHNVTGTLKLLLDAGFVCESASVTAPALGGTIVCRLCHHHHISVMELGYSFLRSCPYFIREVDLHIMQGVQLNVETVHSCTAVSRPMTVPALPSSVPR
jgi:hypothetical protein